MFREICRSSPAVVLLLSSSLFLAVCSVPERKSTGLVRIDGSSTVYPLSEAVAEEFRRSQQDIHVKVGISGTSGGFGKFLRGEVEVLDASRPIKGSELKLAAENGVEFIELPVAYDGIAVVVHPANHWCSSLRVKDLRRIWEPSAQRRILRWNQVRPDWPDEPINLFGPGVDSGTYDYFTRAIVGVEGAGRGDFTSSEDDNVLVWGVGGDPHALGFFGLSYYEENRMRLKVVAIDDENPENGDGPVEPSLATVFSGSYQPLSRPVFIYVSRDAANLPAVERFVDFYLQKVPDLVEEVGYITLPDEAYERVRTRFRKRVTGTMFEASGSQVGLTVEQLLSLETRS